MSEPRRSASAASAWIYAAPTVTVDRATAADKPNIILILSDDFG